MGIKGLHKFIREKFPDALTEINLSDFAYEIVAIDISLYIYRYKSNNSMTWLTSVVNLIGRLRRNHIHCVIIYDSPPPPEKEEERKRRREEREKRNAVIAELEDAIDTYKDMGITTKTLQDFADKHKAPVKKLLVPGINISFIEDKVKRMRTQVNCRPTDEDIIKTKELFDVLNVPYVDAPGEAEAMASKLCRRGKVKAVLSEDGDVIAYRSPLMLRINNTRDIFTQIEYEVLLKSLGWTSNQFVDFCIMCGTDYNKNILGVGPVKSHKLIDEYKNIENVGEATEHDISVLNHVRVREILKNPRSYKINKKYCGRPDINQLRSFYERNCLNFYEEKVKNDFFKTDIIFE